MNAVDMVELTRLSEPAVSPDGRHVIYLRSQVNWTENDEVFRYRIIDLESGTTGLVIEAEAADETFSRPAWRPDGSGFIARLKRGSDKHRQAYLVQLSDLSVQRITEHPEDVDDVQWSARGDRFFFSSRTPLDKEEEDGRENRWLIKEYESVRMREIWEFVLATGETRPVVFGDFDVREYSVSRDGNFIVYARDPDGLHDAPESEVHLVELRSGKTRRITRNAFREQKVRLSPDNRSIAFIATVNAAGQPYFEDNVFLSRIGGPGARPILTDVNMEMLDVEFDASGRGLYIRGNTGLRTNLYHYRFADEKLTEFTAGDHVVDDWEFDAVSGTHAFLLRTAAFPGEVFLIRPGSQQPTRLTSEYAGFVDRFKLPRQAAYSWEGYDGTKLEGLLVYPLGYSAGDEFPLVTITHGGPRSSSQFGSWNVSRYLPVLAGNGYGIFLPNHRGSSGYGDDFMRDMVGGYFTNSHLDVLSGVDSLVDAGLASPDKLVKMGWSAGGHMTNKLVTVTDRFAAASSGAGVADWTSLYGESDTRHNRTPWFGGTPWNEESDHDLYRNQSPLYGADSVVTPTLFMAGENDERVPPTQAILMYRAVKSANATTELFVAPGEKHNFSLPSHRLFKINKELQWYADHLGLSEYRPVYPPDNGRNE